LHSPSDRPFVFTVTGSGKDYLLAEGTDMKYGARHLKRAIERMLVQPLSNLIATDQVVSGDWIQVDFDSANKELVFTKEAEGMEVNVMASMIENTMELPQLAAAASAQVEHRGQMAKSSNSKK